MMPSAPRPPVPFGIRPLRKADARAAARLHRRAFPAFFLSSLGEPFLRQFYAGFPDDPASVCVTAHNGDGVLLAAAVGSLEPHGYFSRLLRRRLLGFAMAGVRAGLRNPRTVRRLVRGVRYRGAVPGAPPGAALLSSICVEPTVRGTGLGGSVLTAWLEECARRGADAAYLTTDSNDNAAVHTFYQRHGWSAATTYATPEGRQMTTFTCMLRGGTTHAR